jgi:hypothetical protein
VQGQIAVGKGGHKSIFWETWTVEIEARQIEEVGKLGDFGSVGTASVGGNRVIA